VTCYAVHRQVNVPPLREHRRSRSAERAYSSSPWSVAQCHLLVAELADFRGRALGVPPSEPVWSLVEK
jgi:hypothetical protein